ncbi:hypothetical protein EYZ11_012050 [Aspergillus tanneri]|uniref:Zn(2)-C6 fungal-type domain-containing protein n=1 Tax=Aspergillus tanneri TaxID=1220188 RepID=A0A4S3J6L2_9EURO|nr:hypothetical protein EYZ11_012050 [Aspergillus tanneri]
MPPTSQNVKKRKSSKHDRTGCLTCRYRRKKCTENTFPACGACIRLNLECVRETRRQVVPSTNTFVDRTGSELDVTSISHAHMLDTFHYDWLPGTQNIETSSRRRYAMKYYIKVLAELLTVSRKYNSFLSG